MDLAIYTLRNAAQAIVHPAFAPILIILALILYFQNRKTAVMQKIIIGESLNSPLELTASQIVLGIFGGVIGSLILTYLGVMFDEYSGIWFIFMVSIALTMIKPRFVCFAYSGAVIGALSLAVNEIATYITGAPAFHGVLPQEVLKIDITALMTMVGVLHIIEGILVAVDGHKGSIPVFTNNNGKIAGGFALKRYWPVPVVIMLLGALTGGGGEAAGDTFEIITPAWWPLINMSFSAEFLKTVAISALPIYAMLGYNSITFTRNKREKALSSGLGIIVYGIILALVAQIAGYNIITKILVLIFAPLAHEIMLRVQSYFEVKEKPVFISEGDGVVVLEIAPNSPAAAMGIKTGDKLIKINDRKIDSENDVLEGIKETINEISVKILKVDGEEKALSYKDFSAGQRLGVVFVPKVVPKNSLVMGYEDMKFKDFLDKINGDDDDDSEE